jgi:hypothetical protein
MKGKSVAMRIGGQRRIAAQGKNAETTRSRGIPTDANDSDARNGAAADRIGELTDRS